MTLRILFVDDEPYMPDLIAQVLLQQTREQACEILFAQHGLEALTMLQTHPNIEIVVTDIRMPQMDGLTLLAKINEIKNNLNPVLTTIIMSAYSDIKSIRKAMNYGAFDFVTKPLDLQDLKITLNKTIDHVTSLKEVITQRKIAYERKERYQRLFEEAPVALWEDNYSAIKIYLDQLRQAGVINIRQYFSDHPDAFLHCKDVTRVTDVNETTLKLFEATSKQELLQKLDQVFQADADYAFLDIFVAVAEGQTRVEVETVAYTLTGKRLDVTLIWLAIGSETKTYNKVLVSVVNITEQKRATQLLADYNHTLSQEVAVRTLELTAANIKLEKAIAKRKKAKKDLQQRNHQLTLLNRISQMFSSSLELEQVLKTVLSEIRQRFDITATSFWFYHAPTGDLVCEYANGVGSEIVIGWRLAKGQGIASQALELGQPMIVPDVLENARHYQQVDRAIGVQLRSLLSLPFRSKGEILGVLNLVDSQPARFTDSDLHLLEPIATAAASAIVNARLFSQEQHQRHMAESLREVTAILNSSLDRDTVLGKILVELKRVVQYQGAGILLQEGAYLVVSRGQVGEQTFVGYKLALTSQDPAIRVFQTQKPLIIPDVRHDPDWQVWPGIEAIRGWMGVPLIVNDKSIGVLAVDSFKAGTYTEIDAQVLQVFAHQAAIAIENSRLFATTRAALEQNETLYHASLALGQTMELTSVLELIVTKLQQVVPYDSASVQALREPSHLEIIAGSGFADLSQILGVKIDLNSPDYPNGMVIRERKPIIINNAQSYLGFQIEPHIHSQVYSWLGIPLLFGDKVLGMIGIDKHQADFYTPDQAHLAMAFAAQAAIAMANANLYSEAQKARAVAEEANKAKSRFIASMSHEFRTPLNGVLGYAQILKRDKNLTPAQLESLEVIQSSGEHLLTLINDVLDMSKIEAGKLKLNMAEFRLPIFLKNISHLVQIRAAEKNINFVYQPYDFEHNRPTPYLPSRIYGDEKRLRQILINLLGNAIKFTEQGEVRFKVGTVGLATAHNTPHLKIRFQIEDTGVGISPSELETIFHPFEQVGDPKHQAEGMGLGLAISHNLVQMMGGNLEVQSQLGGGSIFWFELELAIMPETSAEKPTPQEPTVFGVKGEKRRALIVDDDKLNRMLLVSLLSRQGFETDEAGSGYEGLHKAQQFQPHVILADLMMPDMDGFEMTRQIRAIPELEHIIIIAISANVFPQNRQDSMNAGCNIFIPKPIDTHLLFKTLKQLLGLETVDSPVPVTPRELTPPPFPAAMTPPTQKELKDLLNLALIGDIATIIDKANRLAEANSDLKPFALELRHLAKGFQLKKIREFLRIYLTS